MKSVRWFGVAATALGISMLALPALAHHGWSGQGAEQIEVSGKVHKPVSLTNPHASMQIISDGQVWDVTLAPPARTEGAGLTAKSLAVGDAVTVRGNRNSDPKRFEIKTVRVTSGGRNYDVYPDRIK
jgi:hypothetical protein